MSLTWGDIGKFILAFFLPPLGVLTEKEHLDRDFWINCLLTLIAWLPGEPSSQHRHSSSEAAFEPITSRGHSAAGRWLDSEVVSLRALCTLGQWHA